MTYQAQYSGSTVEYRQPWYLRRSCPIFCSSCQGVYEGIYPARRVLLLAGTALWIVGFIFVLAAVLVCIAGICSAVAASLCPVGILLMFVGYGIFHCAWAAYLLDEPGASIVSQTSTNTWETPRERSRSPRPKSQDGQAFEVHEDEEENPQRTGFWQFVEQPAWQAVATRDRLQ